MKTLFVYGLLCVVLGLVSFLVLVPHASPQRFQTGGIGVGSAPWAERRPMPAAIGSILIVGGLSMMVGGCREPRK
jgi:hypothetical protein